MRKHSLNADPAIEGGGFNRMRGQSKTNRTNVSRETGCPDCGAARVACEAQINNCVADSGKKLGVVYI